MSRMKANIKAKLRLSKRAAHVKKTIERAISTKDAVKKLSDKLFISESTIYKDLAK